MKKIRILSAVLAILLTFSALGLPVFAADPVDIVNYPSTEEWISQQEKLSSMTLMYEDDNWAMYFDLASAEFALKNKKTEELTFSNPYDIAFHATSSNDPDNDPIRQALLSQIILTYEDVATGAVYTMKSFTDAVLAGDQIAFTKLSDGVRVEYAIGTLETKRLFPSWITVKRFNENILDVLKEAAKANPTDQVLARVINRINVGNTYVEVGPYDPETMPAYDPKLDPNPALPYTYKYLVDNPGETMYVLANMGERLKKELESMIRKYCPEYTFDKLEEDHEITGYEGNEKEPPLFRMAVEYKIDKDGLTVTIPGKSIRYNQTNYRLNSIALLPYFGCTATGYTTGAPGDTDGSYTRNDGYLFIPDGSGTILNYYNEDGSYKTGAQGGSMYGQDFAIESLEATNANAATYRVPVFGLVESYTHAKNQIIDVPSLSGTSETKDQDTIVNNYTRALFAIIEEGESFATIRANLRESAWAGASGNIPYSTVYAIFSVKQSDSVNVGSSIGGSNSSMTATSDTKYIGNYSIRYITLSDPEIAAAKNYESFEPSYIGMAKAYREYLIEKGALDKLAASETESTLPLYIHSFGALDAQSTFLSIPITVEQPLTTFADIQTMSEDLKSAGITNLNFILEGFANGNMSKPYYPTYVKWGKTVGGADGFEELMIYAKDNGIGIYPDFDFSTAYWVKTFSGFSYRKHAARAMSGRYTTKRDYDYVFQVISKFGRGNVVSSGAYLDLFEKFAKDYDKYYVGGISVLSLGNDLNSDFNEDYAITREDSKINTMELLAKMREHGYNNLVVGGGNAYTWAYATDILGIPLDNSSYQISSASIPFVGMVLHGYMNYTGGVINTSGDVRYDVLKSLENGAALYFLLSKQNSNLFKNAIAMGLNENYSVNYDTWREDVISYYKELNGAIGSLQNATISDHGFVTAYRADAKLANYLFTQSNGTQSAYLNEIAKRDSLKATVATFMSRGDTSGAREPYRQFVEARTLISTTLEPRAKLEAAFSNKESVANVVYVTYTEDNGNATTFYINYNDFDVAVEYGEGDNWGIEILPAQSFINVKDIEVETVPTLTYEIATAFQPSAGQITRYQTAKENYDEAVASGNENKEKKAKETLDKTIAEITTKRTINVVKIAAEDGSGVAYFNYENTSVLVKVSETEYVVIPAQSYVLN